MRDCSSVSSQSNGILREPSELYLVDMRAGDGGEKMGEMSGVTIAMRQ